jgi:hypothetical protein
VARSRRRGLVGASLLSLLGLGALALGLLVVREVYLASLPREVPERAGRAFFDVVTSDLWRAVTWVAVGAAVVLVLALVVRRPSRG